ncbi:MAG: hypothetical protein ABI824_15055 [Acidobacteriota bacterium]
MISARRPTKAEIKIYEDELWRFQGGERSKFHRPNAELRLPVYLDADVQAYLAEPAAQKGVPLGEMVNGLLKQEIQMIESVK